MIVASILVAAAGAIVLSELLGRGKVVYTRMFTLVGSYLICSGAAGWLLMRQSGDVADAAAIVLSGVPLMGAWLGFRIHLSNSITLEMATLLDDGRARTIDEIAAEYDVDGHTRTRVEILRVGGYLAADADATVTDSAKSRAILRLIRLLCGPDGPRSVAARLRGRGDGIG
jgi:hypothetical protein